MTAPISARCASDLGTLTGRQSASSRTGSLKTTMRRPWLACARRRRASSSAAPSLSSDDDDPVVLRARPPPPATVAVPVALTSSSQSLLAQSSIPAADAAEDGGGSVGVPGGWPTSSSDVRPRGRLTLPLPPSTPPPPPPSPPLLSVVVGHPPPVTAGAGESASPWPLLQRLSLPAAASREVCTKPPPSKRAPASSLARVPRLAALSRTSSPRAPPRLWRCTSRRLLNSRSRSATSRTGLVHVPPISTTAASENSSASSSSGCAAAGGGGGWGDAVWQLVASAAVLCGRRVF